MKIAMEIGLAILVNYERKVRDDDRGANETGLLTHSALLRRETESAEGFVRGPNETGGVTNAPRTTSLQTESFARDPTVSANPWRNWGYEKTPGDFSPGVLR